jgi:hypothetical protein
VGSVLARPRGRDLTRLGLSLAGPTAGRTTVPVSAAGISLALCCVLVLAVPADADGPWILWGGRPGKEAAGTRVSEHRTLSDCLHEQKSLEDEQRAYLRAAGEARPEDRLPPPGPADSYRCLPDPGGSRGPRKN